ncbi:MAG TPA: PQQ-binding-like beta-propeller repeat protein [Planctomycetaceae bacterium]|nr:PQQ-binding-like beta-propeller repeat protein [Planctomycetaceae bacterium]
MQDGRAVHGALRAWRGFDSDPRSAIRDPRSQPADTRRRSIAAALRVLAVAAAAALLCPAAVDAQEWARFRGPNGSGVGEAARVPVRWSDGDLNWKTALPGTGHSSPVLWGARLFLTCGDDETGRRILCCLDAGDGRIVWTRDYDTATHRRHQLNSLASSTPCVDERHIYLLWTTDREVFAAAYDHAGEPVWRKRLAAYKAGHGSGVSPVVHDGLMIVANEHSGDSELLALEAATGDVRWRVPRKSQVQYSTPCIYQRPGRRTEVIFTNWENGISGVDLQTGRVAWERRVFDESHIECSISSPIVAGDLVLGTCGWLGHGEQTVAVRPDEARPGTAVEVYRVDRGAPLTPTPLVKDDLLFLWADDGIVTCVDSRTGELVWRQRVGGTYYGSPVAAGDAVYCVSADGEMVVIAASREFELLARNPLGEVSHATPAVANGVMYVRTVSQVMAVGGPEHSDAE